MQNNMLKCLSLVAPLFLALSGSGAQAPAPASASALRTAFLDEIRRPAAPLNVSPVTATTERGYQQEVLSFDAEPGERVPVLTLRKGDTTERRAVVIALHGTGGSMESMRSMLQSFADRGWLAVSMDARHHGQRATPIPGLANPYQSAMLRAYSTGVGHPYLYDTVWDVMRLIDYLSSRPDVDPNRIGLIGNSKGGTEAYLVAAADPRVKVVVPLIGVQSFGWSLRRPSAWEARTWTLKQATEAAAALAGERVDAAFVRKFYNRIAPGLVDRFDGPAMLPLIAPRALLVVNADSDPRSPMGGVREATVAAERAYAAAGVPEKFSFFLEVDAAHEVTPQAMQASISWLERWLAPPAR